MRHLVSPSANVHAISQLFATVRNHGVLIYELGRRDVADRYVGRFLGILWAVVNPALQLSIYVSLFTFVFGTRIDGNATSGLNSVVYIFAGLISWFFTIEVLGKSVDLLRANAPLLKQIVFPVEVLPLKTCVAGVLVQLAYILVLLILLGSAMPRNVPAMLELLPVALLIQFVLLSGIAFFLSLAGLAIPDLKEVVQFFTTTGLFLTPILYSPLQLDHLPRPLIMLIASNPFSHVVWCYQDAIYFGEIRHGASWLIASILAIVVLTLGFRAFVKVKPYFVEQF
jgi:lipopolysaccharide transport system permease protein